MTRVVKIRLTREALCRENEELRMALKNIATIIEHVENRCMAVDGPVTPTLDEMTQEELSRIYALALMHDLRAALEEKKP